MKNKSKGIQDAAAISGDPQLAQLMENMKGDLIIALVLRLGGDVTIPAKEIDGMGKHLLSMSVDPATQSFRFVAESKN